MDNLRFVLESPQLNQTHKKRPRLVTSCDNCRLKKIKCVQTKSHRCEACEAANVSCEFRDRERYFAERSRIVTGASAGSSGHSRRSSTPGVGKVEGGSMYGSSPEPQARSSSEWYASGVPSPSLETVHQSRYMSGSPAPYSSSQSASDMWMSPGVQQRSAYLSSPLANVSGVDHSALPSGLPQDASGYHRSSILQRDSHSVALFDPRQPEFPHPTLMTHLIQVFFERFDRNFPFLRSDDVSKRHYSGSLSPALANSIAALGARYSQHPEIVGRGTSIVVDNYSNNAKQLLSLGSSSHYPYIEILHAVILIAWSEYKNARTAGFYEYSQMAMKMAISLGLSNDTASQNASEREQYTYQATWAVVSQLQQLSSM